MGFRAKGRLALTIAAAMALAALTSTPPQACENCAPSDAGQSGKAANALPTYPEPTEEVSEPVKLKKFTKPQTRSAGRTQSRKATLSERARGSQSASRKAKPIEQEDDQTEASARSNTVKTVAPSVANANAELVVPGAAKQTTAEVSDQAQPAAIQPAATQPVASETQVSSASPPEIELVSADEFNVLDRAAWETNQMPKLMNLTGSDSRAELRDGDSRWAQTSAIGKLFVAFGALLTIGSAIRMLMA